MLHGGIFSALQEMLQKVPLFQQSSYSFVRDITSLLKLESYHMGDVIFRKGEVLRTPELVPFMASRSAPSAPLTYSLLCAINVCICPQSPGAHRPLLPHSPPHALHLTSAQLGSARLRSWALQTAAICAGATGDVLYRGGDRADLRPR